MSIADDDMRDRLGMGPRTKAESSAAAPEDMVERVGRAIIHYIWNDGAGLVMSFDAGKCAEAAIAAMSKNPDNLNTSGEHVQGLNVTEMRLLNDVLSPPVKHEIADSIVVESRSKSDIVQDVWDELVQRGLVREQKREIVSQPKRSCGEAWMKYSQTLPQMKSTQWDNLQDAFDCGWLAAINSIEVE